MNTKNIPRRAIKVAGIGGAGCNMLDYMLAHGFSAADCIIMNTDKHALQYASCPHKLLLGEKVMRGLDGGGILRGQRCALESRDAIAKALNGAQIVLLIAGLGASSSGAAPLIAQIARDLGILTICVVTMPFLFEGRRRTATAEQGLADLLSIANTVIVFPNELLLKLYGRPQNMVEAFSQSDNHLQQIVQYLTGLINEPGFIKIESERLWQILQNAGLAHYAAGSIMQGCNMLQEAEDLLYSDLLSSRDNKAQQILLHIDVPAGTTIAEAETIFAAFRAAAGADTQIVAGARHNANLTNTVEASILAFDYPNQHIIKLANMATGGMQY